MTNKELNEKLRETDHKEWFKNLKIQINLDYIDYSLEKEGFEDIYQFIHRQYRGFEKLEDQLPSELNQSKSYITRTYSSLNQFVENAKSWNTSQLNSQWSNIDNEIKAYRNRKLLPIDSPVTSFLIDVNNNYGSNYYAGAYNYLVKHSQSISFPTSEHLSGAFMAYEFKYSESTKISQRRRHEKSSNSRLRNEFEKYFTETGKHLNEHLDTNEEKVSEYSKNMDSLLEEKKNEFDNWYTETVESFSKFNEEAIKKIEENEELYKEKLKLEAPATYWRDRAKTLREEGNNWLIGLLISSGLAVLALAAVLYFISDGTLKDLFSQTGSAIRWSVVFITFVSFLAFAIRTFAKLTFSSFHLVRDAEEREQLAYVYLALKKEKNIDETERHLVMQSIFSRAESGLLGSDNSPTMPGNIVDKFISKN